MVKDLKLKRKRYGYKFNFFTYFDHILSDMHVYFGFTGQRFD